MTIKVLIVDDSLLIRGLFEKILASDPDIRVVATAEDAYDAREKIKKYNPDVITLDVEMPKMDGVTFLEKIMTLRPMPVVMVSTLTKKGADVTLRALEIGAVDYIAKPTDVQNPQNLATLQQALIDKVKMAAAAKVRSFAKENTGNAASLELPPGRKVTKKLIAIGSSTGGVEALREVLTKLPANMPPIVIVQHMPAKFTPSFAARINSLCRMTVHEAADGQKILPGNVYIAPGGQHLSIAKAGTGFLCKVEKGENVSGHCPSVDVLFQSVASNLGHDMLGVILTGMGKDGAKGMLAMKNAGAYNLAQDEASCVVYGMPKEAVLIGAVDKEISLGKMAEAIINQCTT